MNVLFLSFAFFCFSLPAQSETNFLEMPSKNKPFSVSLQTEFFRSQSNYHEWGQYDLLPNNNYFQYVGFFPSIHYSPFKDYIRFQIFAKSFYAKSANLGANSVPFRLSLVGGGMEFYYKLKTLYLGIELKGGIPLDRHLSTDPKQLILGDGEFFIEPGGWIILHPSQSFDLYYNIAFRYRMAEISSLLFNRLGGVLRTKYIDFGSSMDVFFTVIADVLSTQKETRHKLLEINGGSYKFRSVDPAVLSFTLWTDLKFKPFFSTIYCNFDILGKHYARGLTLGLVKTLKWSTLSPLMRKRNHMKSFEFEGGYSPPRSESKRKKPYFEEEEDTYETFYEEEEEPPSKKEGIKKELKKELNLLRY